MNKKLFSLIFGFTLTATTAFAAPGHGGAHGDDAIGKPGQTSTVTRTVKVDMTDDMRFTPANIAAKQGETIRFEITNSGNIKHEFVIGSEQDLKQHYAAMMQHSEMQHSDPNMVTLAGGKTGQLIWQFTKAGTVNFACLQPGHYDAGMKGEVVVNMNRHKIRAN